MERIFEQKHYIYKITLLCGTKSGYYYIGKHTTKKGRNPETDVYWGSGTIIKEYIKKYGAIEGETLHKEILEYNNSAEENTQREKEIIGNIWKTEPLCLNLKEGGDGGQLSDCAKEKISKALKGYIHSEQSRHNMSKAHIGKEPWNKGISMTEEQCEKNRQGHIGIRHTEEWKKNMSEKMKGRPGVSPSEETKAKISSSLQGRKRTKKSRQKQSETMTGRKLSKEWAQHIGDGHRGMKHTQESIEKMRNTTKNDAVICIYPDGTQDKFISKIDAERKTGIMRSTISRNIKNNTTDKYGNRWLLAS